MEDEGNEITDKLAKTNNEFHAGIKPLEVNSTIKLISCQIQKIFRKEVAEEMMEKMWKIQELDNLQQKTHNENCDNVQTNNWPNRLAAYLTQPHS